MPIMAHMLRLSSRRICSASSCSWRASPIRLWTLFEICPLAEADAFNLKAPIRGKPECDCMRIFLFTAHSVSLRTSREEKNQACGVILLLRGFSLIIRNILFACCHRCNRQYQNVAQIVSCKGVSANVGALAPRPVDTGKRRPCYGPFKINACWSR